MLFRSLPAAPRDPRHGPGSPGEGEAPRNEEPRTSARCFPGSPGLGDGASSPDRSTPGASSPHPFPPNHGGPPVGMGPRSIIDSSVGETSAPGDPPTGPHTPQPQRRHVDAAGGNGRRRSRAAGAGAPGDGGAPRGAPSSPSLMGRADGDTPGVSPTSTSRAASESLHETRGATTMARRDATRRTRRPSTPRITDGSGGPGPPTSFPTLRPLGPRSSARTPCWTPPRRSDSRRDAASSS